MIAQLSSIRRKNSLSLGGVSVREDVLPLEVYSGNPVDSSSKSRTVPSNKMYRRKIGQATLSAVQQYSLRNGWMRFAALDKKTVQ